MATTAETQPMVIAATPVVAAAAPAPTTMQVTCPEGVVAGALLQVQGPSGPVNVRDNCASPRSLRNRCAKGSACYACDRLVPCAGAGACGRRTGSGVHDPSTGRRSYGRSGAGTIRSVPTATGSWHLARTLEVPRTRPISIQNTGCPDCRVQMMQQPAMMAPPGMMMTGMAPPNMGGGGGLEMLEACSKVFLKQRVRTVRGALLAANALPAHTQFALGIWGVLAPCAWAPCHHVGLLRTLRWSCSRRSRTSKLAIHTRYTTRRRASSCSCEPHESPPQKQHKTIIVAALGFPQWMPARTLTPLLSRVAAPT